MIRSAAILARGLGSRMRHVDAAVQLDARQARVAASGVKAMMPMAGGAQGAAARPFLDYVISALADSGITHVVLVLGGEHDDVREYYVPTVPARRTRISFALQPEPIGTANAVVCAAAAVDEETFLVLNADNYYPIEALRLLASHERAATIAFDRDALVRDGNIDAERVRAFAVLEIDERDRLCAIVEKPGATLDVASPAARWVGMNCWAVTPAIVDACARVPKSSRGEFELPEAVARALREGVNVHAYRVAAPVLDLSHRADVSSVARALQQIEARP